MIEDHPEIHHISQTHFKRIREPYAVLWNDIITFEKAKRTDQDRKRWRFVTGNVNRHATW